MDNKKLILFDFDGTLIDSVPDLAIAINAMLHFVDKPSYSEDQIRQWVGNGAQTLVKRALTGQTQVKTPLDEGYFNHALEIFLTEYEKNICTRTLLYPYVNETLSELKSRGYTMALVTNKPYKFVQPILEGLAMDSFFDYCIGGDSLERKKPDPLPLLHVCEKLGMSVDASVMVGDSKNDILAAKATGMQSIGVTYGYNYGENIEAYEPDVIINDMKEILTVL